MSVLVNQVNELSAEKGTITEDKLALYLEFARDKKSMTKLPVAGVDIFFNDDKWDFSKLDKLNSNYSVLRFSTIHESYKQLVKWAVLKEKIHSRKKMSTIYNELQWMKKVVRFLVNERILNPKFITLFVVKKYIEMINDEFTLENLRKQRKNVFILLLKQLGEDNPGVDYHLLISELQKYDSNKNKAQRKVHKTPMIPNEYITDLVSSALEEIQSGDKTISRQVEEACVILLLSQTGMRIGELRLLEAQKKKHLSILNDTEQASYLEFVTFKTVKQNEFRWTYCVLNEIAEKAYDVLEKITEVRRKKGGSNYLFTSEKSDRPRSFQSFRNDILKFVARNHKKLNCLNLQESSLIAYTLEDNQEKKRSGYHLSKSQRRGLRDSDVIHFPRPHQFRVTLATHLYEKGVSIDWIKEHMNHLSEEMTIHYIRFDEEKSRKDLLLKEMIKKLNEDAINQSEKQIVKNIDKFLMENKLNIHADIMDVLLEIDGDLPIREKEQGYCIKSSFGRKCPKNEMIDIKDNLYIHLANCEFLDITYNRFKRIQKTIEYNKNAGFILEAEREEKRMRKLLDSYLIPEYEDLLNEISIKNIHSVQEEYPHLKEIVLTLDDIGREIEVWKTRVNRT